jgi:hypothetical protein
MYCNFNVSHLQDLCHHFYDVFSMSWTFSILADELSEESSADQDVITIYLLLN